MKAEHSDDNEPDERLFAVLSEFLESAERGALLDRAALLADHPELAPELEAFLDTWVRVEALTEPIRSASQALRAAGSSARIPDTRGNQPRETIPPSRVDAEPVEKPENNPVERPLEPGNEEGGWLGRWLRKHPPLSGQDYPFLHKPRATEEIGRLGPYRLLEVIGSGGMGIVFRGEDLSLRRPVAVKVLRAELAADPASRERFLREARSAAALDHENVIAVYHVGEECGIPFLGMQWLRGQSLEELLRQAGWLSVPTVLKLGHQIALGLAAAHGQGLLHRDIKPANLWIEYPGPESVVAGAGPKVAATSRVKILDFGLARTVAEEGHLTQSGVTVGTPAYMSPEQAAGSKVDARSDLFGLGVVLYRMCTGKLPFPGRQSADKTALPAKPPTTVRALNATVPTELSDLVMELLDLEPARRPASAAVVATRLKALESQGATPAASMMQTTPPRVSPIARPAGGRDWRRATAAAALALTTLLVLGSLFGGTVLRFATNSGEVVIAVDDPDTDVTVKEGGAVIEDRKGQRRITLTAGAHELELSVREPGGEMHFFTKSFVVRRGGKEVLNISQELGQVVKPIVARTADNDRAVAEWALALGAKVIAREANRNSEIRNAKDLPEGNFRLIALDLSDKVVDDASLARIGSLTELQDLRLSRTSAGDSALAHLSGMKSLRRLFLDQTKVGDIGLEHLRALTGLDELNLGRTAVGDAGLASLEPLGNLHFLALDETRLSDAGLAHLEGLTSLRELNLSSTRVTDAGLVHLRSLKELEVLSLNSLKITGAGLAHLEGLTKLRRLYVPATRVTDEGLVHLAKLAALEQLALDNTLVTDAGLSRLLGLKNLAAINVSGPGVTDAGLEALGKMTNLHQLGLFGSRVTDAGLAHLDKLSNLEILNLSGLPISEVGLAHVRGATRLHRLELEGSRMSDASLKGIISGNWPLIYLGLKNTRVSSNGHALLKTTYPGAEIPWSEPNRTVAQSVLAIGGSVQIRVSGRREEQLATRVGELPGEYFIVTRYRLPAGAKVPEDLPRKLSALRDPKLDGLEAADFSGGPCELGNLKDLLPGTITDLTLTNTLVNDDDLVHLKGFSLRRLSLEGSRVRGNGLSHLSAAPRLAQSLTDLSLARTQFSDVQMVHLRSLPKLRRLDLSGCPVRGPGLKILKEMPELREAIIACPTLTDLFAEDLGNLKQIERLSLAKSSVTDSTLKCLDSLKNMRELDLTATKVTIEGVATLRKALPLCHIKAASAGPQ